MLANFGCSTSTVYNMASRLQYTRSTIGMQPNSSQSLGTGGSDSSELRTTRVRDLGDHYLHVGNHGCRTYIKRKKTTSERPVTAFDA